MPAEKVIAIAGASSGSGAAMAQYLARRGHAVSLCARREIPLHEIRDAILSSGGRAMALQADMSVWEEAEKFIRRTVKEFGCIDVLINNAGAGIRYDDFVSLSVAEIDEGVAVNLMTVLYGCRAALPHMIRRRKGHIINTSSAWGKSAKSGLAVYSAAKHGVEGFSRALLGEVRRYGIKVSVLAPLAIDSEWARKAGLDDSGKQCRLKPEDIAVLVERLIDTPANLNVWNLDCMSMKVEPDPL
jgi:3-oxoacyl-[acyl-carrier protein] reductase